MNAFAQGLCSPCSAWVASTAAEQPFASRYTVAEAPAVLIRIAVVLIGDGERRNDVDVQFRDGRIGAVGEGLEVPADAVVIDAEGRWVTPGLIDVQSHLGNHPAPVGTALADGNELTSANTAAGWAEHGIWPQDPQAPQSLKMA